VIACVHQPNYLPWLGFFAKLARSDLYIVMDNVQFPRNSWTNRVRIGGNGPLVWLTVPVRHSGDLETVIGEMEIDYKQDWRRRHLRTIQQRYARCPAFDAIFARLTGVLETRPRLLIDLNLRLIEMLMTLCKISTRVLMGSQLGGTGRGSHLVASMCARAGASVYLAGEGSVAYEEMSAYSANSIEHRLSSFEHPKYPQRGQGTFLPGLSILDALFCIGPEKTRDLLVENKQLNVQCGDARDH
jgi:hypothetical protein